MNNNNKQRLKDLADRAMKIDIIKMEKMKILMELNKVDMDQSTLELKRVKTIKRGFLKCLKDDGFIKILPFFILSIISAHSSFNNITQIIANIVYWSMFILFMMGKFRNKKDNRYNNLDILQKQIKNRFNEFNILHNSLILETHKPESNWSFNLLVLRKNIKAIIFFPFMFIMGFLTPNKEEFVSRALGMVERDKEEVNNAAEKGINKDLDILEQIIIKEENK